MSAIAQEMRLFSAPVPRATTFEFSLGEVEVAAAMSAQGIWYVFRRNRDGYQPIWRGTTDARRDAERACEIADDYICLMAHNRVHRGDTTDDIIPYLCYPRDPNYAYQNARDAKLFAQVERDKGKRRALPEFATPEARQIEGLLAEIPPGPLREVMAEVSEKLLHHAETE